MLNKKMWIILLLFVTVGTVVTIAEEKRPKYRPPTAEELRNQFEISATNTIVEALRLSNFSAKINEAIHCPCYDIYITTQPNATIIRIDNEKCEEIK